MKSHDSTQHGEFSWNELVTTDYQAAFNFYSALLGWQHIDTMDMGPMGMYLMYGRDGKTLGGMMNRPAMMPANAWIYYVTVSDLEGAIAKATARGAQVLFGPMDVPGGDRIAQLLDPQGVLFALHSKIVAA